MIDARSWISPVVLAAAVVAYLLLGSASSAPVAARGGVDGVDGARFALTAGGDAARALPPAAPLRWGPAIAPSDQEVIRRVIAEARPEARRLIELVAGMVNISVGRARPGTAGEMIALDDGYLVQMDLGGVYRTLGMRGVRRLILHELAHVVDHALVPHALERQLDAATPPGFGCDDGTSGGCTARVERFAESFAKWATGDIGNDLYLGYRVPPPTSLSRWGAPLAALTR
jgi:hypothetical protein